MLRPMNKRSTVLLPLAVASVLASVLALACSDSTAPVLQVQSPPPPSGTSRVASVQITSAPTTVEAGSSASLSCVVMDAHGAALDVTKTWHVSDTSVAAVSAAGLFVARKLGTSLVTCAADAYSATVPVSVTQSPVDFVEVSPGAAPLMVGSSVQLVGVPLDETGSPVADHPIQWSVDDSAVASVSPSGQVTARGEGTATITAASGGKTGMAMMSVSSTRPAPVASMTLSSSSSTINIGETTNISAQLQDAAGRNSTIER